MCSPHTSLFALATRAGLLALLALSRLLAAAQTYSAPATITNADLVDFPMVTSGAAPIYLDGTQWVASTAKNSTLFGEIMQQQMSKLSSKGFSPSSASLFSVAPFSASLCDFTAGLDYNRGVKCPVVNATSMEDCCLQCSISTSCAAGVFEPVANASGGGGGGSCFLKTAADLHVKSLAPSTVAACVLKSAEPAPAPAPQAAVKLAIPATVPGDLISDLQRAGVIGDPWYELNWITDSHLWNGYNSDWTYSVNFTLPATGTGEQQTDHHSSSDINSTIIGDSSVHRLVFDGIKMGARVLLNGVELGNVTNQFVRYTFDVQPGLLFQDGTSSNTLSVVFDKALPLEGRFMACSGGWDWAPYSYSKRNDTYCSGETPTFSRGIWKSVYLIEVPLETAAITHVTPHTRYIGTYPTKALVDGEHGGFVVNVTTHLWIPPGGATGSVSVHGSWGGSSQSADTGTMRLAAGEHAVSISINATAEDIKLWWPNTVNGFGPDTPRPFYNVTAVWRSSSAPAWSNSTSKTVSSNRAGEVAATRRIAFRVFALVTANDTDAAYVTANATADGSAHHGMFFRVNGVAVYSRGANMIPMEELEGRLDAGAHRILVHSAASARMNTMRVWGGGVYYPRAFYEACDEFGIMVYHDMAYNGGDGIHAPNASASQAAELRHQVRRLSHHPSIVMWDGGNEIVVTPNTTTYLYATFVMSTVASEDQSRVVWPSSPASGWVTGVNRLYGTPNGSPHGLTTAGGGHIWQEGQETHAPYQLGSGWPSVNGGPTDSCYDRWGLVHIPNSFKSTNDTSNTFGVAQRNVYASEFGTSSSSSFESYSAVLAPQHWGLHGGEESDTCMGDCQAVTGCKGSNVMAQRNYACDGPIHLVFGNHTSIDLNATGARELQGQTYLCLLSQALVMKQVIEERRGANQFGALIWQLNEIWPTNGWGSIEYGTGQGEDPTAALTANHVRGGRWKPLHYYYGRSLFADIVATCGIEYKSAGVPACYVRSDRAVGSFSGTVTLTSYSVNDPTGTPTTVRTFEVSLPQGPGAVEWLNVEGLTFPDPNSTLLVATVTDATNGAVLSEHIVGLAYPKALKQALVLDVNVTAAVADSVNADGTIDIVVSSDAIALYTTLTSLAQGRFSDNSFLLLPGEPGVIIKFLPFRPNAAEPDLDMLKKSLRVEHLAMYA